MKRSILLIVCLLGLFSFVRPVQAQEGTPRQPITLANAYSIHELWRLDDLPSGGVNDAALSPDGKLLATAGADNLIRLWDVETHTVVKTLDYHTDVVYSVAFSPDGKYLASASDDGSVWVWNLEIGEMVTMLNGFDRMMRVVTFSPDGTLIAFGGPDSVMRVWNIKERHWMATAERLRWYWNQAFNWDVALSSDGNFVAFLTDEGTVRVWNVMNNQLAADLVGLEQGRFNGLATSPVGNLLALAGSDGYIYLYNTRMLTVPLDYYAGWLVPYLRGVTGLEFSSDGKLLVSSASSNGTSTILFLDALHSEPSPPSEIGFERQGTVRDMEFSQDNTLLVFVTEDSVEFWGVPADLDIVPAMTWTPLPTPTPWPTPRADELSQTPPFYTPTPSLVPPTLTPSLTPTMTLTPTHTLTPSPTPFLQVGGQAVVHVAEGDTLNVRAGTGGGFEILEKLANGSAVILLEGPVSAEDYTWWRIRTPGGVEGWAVESADGIQTLVAVPTTP